MKEISCEACGTVGQTRTRFKCDNCGTAITRVSRVNYMLTYVNPLSKKKIVVNACKAACLIDLAMKQDKVEASWEKQF